MKDTDMSTATFQVVEYVLPNEWACYFINGESCGMELYEIENADAWWDDTFKGERANCVDCLDDSSFMKYHDGEGYSLPGDCSTFVFHVG